MTDEPFDPVVDTFRSMFLAMAIVYGGASPDEAVERHRRWWHDLQKEESPL